MWRGSWFRSITVILFLLITAGCASLSPKGPAGRAGYYDRIIAVGDIHGSYSGLVSILKRTNLIDQNNRWIGGKALLVQTGDVLDRGADVRQVMDLLMSLQRQAEAAGGRVFVLLADHEVLNIIGSTDYTNPDAFRSFIDSHSEERQKEAFDVWSKFFKPATESNEGVQVNGMEQWNISHPPGFVEYMEALGPEGYYGKWLRTLPTIFRYGGTVFIHSGISPSYMGSSDQSINQMITTDIQEFDRIKGYLLNKGFVRQFFSIAEIMSMVEGILKFAEEGSIPSKVDIDLAALKDIDGYLKGLYETFTSPLMSENGPLWFRGFAEWPDEQLTAYVPQWLNLEGSWRVIVGHTPQLDGRIKSRLDGNIFLIDTGMFSEYFKGGQASALEIEYDEVSAIYETGERVAFPAPRIDYGIEHVWVDAEGNRLPFDSVADVELFLKTASPASTEVIHTGVNTPQKVLLEKDNIRANAIFRYQAQAEDAESVGGTYVTRFFRDSYSSEIAAYEINRMLGLNNMPPTVYRLLNGQPGTMQLWAEKTMSDNNRAQKNILPPESRSWNRQMWDMRVFDNLINNVDRNQGNILIDNNWRLILIDHTRSFAKDRSLPSPKDVIHCSRGLWHALLHLDLTEAGKRLQPYLDPSEIEALFVRRERLIELIKGLIKQEGEENVLF